MGVFTCLLKLSHCMRTKPELFTACLSLCAELAGAHTSFPVKSMKRQPTGVPRPGRHPTRTEPWATQSAPLYNTVHEWKFITIPLSMLLPAVELNLHALQFVLEVPRTSSSTSAVSLSSVS